METRRPTTPTAEEILGGYFPVLDHGFVGLVDYMGSDEDVERAARVSYGYGTRRTSQTRGLVRYLRRHHHTTPSEMVELKFHCVMPIFVARQWVRHRTACLAEGTEVYFDLPGGSDRRRNQLHKLRIEEIWERFQPTADRTRPDDQRHPYFRRDLVRAMKLRQVNEETFRIQHTRVLDVFRNGPKPVFRMTLSEGRTIECTADHRFLFAEGWRTLRDAVGLREAGGRAAWTAGDHRLHVNGMVCEEPALQRERDRLEEQCHHVPGGRDLGPEWLTRARRARSAPAPNSWRGAGSTNRESIGRWTTPAAARVHARDGWTCDRSRLARIERFEYRGIRETYDLEVEGPYHNFIANGIVTHNSVNELSARYSLMPLLFYRPDAAQFELQSRSNKQGREGGATPQVYQEAVRRWEALRHDAGDAYGWMLGQDVARELARIDLPLSTYTQWYWKIDLHNLLHFLTLRVDPRAQWEIQEYGRVMAGMVKRVAPLSYEAWIDYDLSARPFTRAEREAIARLIEADGQGVRAREGAALGREQLVELGMSGREIAELIEKLQPPERPDFELDLSRMRSAESVAEEMAEAVPGSTFD